jgi:hypothetical protein
MTKGVTHMKRLFLLTTVALAGAALVLAASSAAAVPQNTAKPTISGSAKAGSTLTASEGTWANSPTSLTYQWQRCADDGSGCGDISGATSKTYTLSTGDVGHTVVVVVTAANADGKASASSDPSDVVGSANGPRNDVRPLLSGGATVGDSLAVSNGSWTPTPTSFSRQWQRCDSSGATCRDISGATGRTYNLASADVGHRVRALVTAHTAAGQTTVATAPSALVASGTTTSTTTTTTTVTTPAPRVPTVRIVSLTRVGTRVHIRFRVCAQKPGLVRITERDQKARALPYTRHFSVYVGSCATSTRSWLLLSRYRRPGRLVVTLRATDGRGLLSRLASRALIIR